jgi:hypothetical protein
LAPQNGHGGESDVERTAWIAACGPGIAAGSEMGTLRHVDVAAHVYEAVGLAEEMAAHPLEGKAFAAVA